VNYTKPVTAGVGGAHSGEVRPVEITFVGSGDAFGSGGRFQTCI